MLFLQIFTIFHGHGPGTLGQDLSSVTLKMHVFCQICHWLCLCMHLPIISKRHRKQERKGWDKGGKQIDCTSLAWLDASRS